VLKLEFSILEVAMMKSESINFYRKKV